MIKKINNMSKSREKKDDNALILEGWNTFLSEYKSIELTETEKAIFGKSKIVQKNERGLAYTTKGCIKSTI